MAPVIIDNLHKFGIDFQAKIVAGIWTDRAFLERVIDIIDIEVFENEAHKWIVNEIILGYSQYKEIPTLHQFKVRLDTIPTDDFKAVVQEQLGLIEREVKKSTDLQFVRDQYLEFCKNQKLKNAINESVDYLKTGEYDKIKATVDKAMKAGAERNLGHDYHKDVAVRYSTMARNGISTGWSVIDDLMDGGLGPGELGIIVAPSGIGKSWLLCSLGHSAMKAGKNVAHFTLELNENYVGRRYDCCFTGIYFQEIKDKQAAVEEKMKSIRGRLKIKYFPLKTVTAQSLKFHVERIQALEGIKIDEMIVDYPDLLRPLEKEKNANSYTEMGNVYEELVQVAGQLQIPVWGASQTNRSGILEDVIQANNIADSYRKIMTGDFVISASRNLQDKLNHTARFHVIKNRFGPDGITLYSKMDTNNGRIEMFDSATKESSEVRALMERG